MRISDFESPNIRFEEILTSLVTRHLEAAFEATMSDLDAAVSVRMREMSAAELMRGLPSDFLLEQIRARQESFRTEAVKLYPHMLELFPARSAEFENRIDKEVKRARDSAFLDACVGKLFPEIRESVKRRTEREICAEMQDLQPDEIGSFSFIEFSSRYEARAEAAFHDDIVVVNTALVSRPEFAETVSSLRDEVASIVKSHEQEKRSEFTRFQNGEQKNLDALIDAKLRRREEELRRLLKAEEERQIREIEEKTARELQELRRQAVNERIRQEQKRKAIEEQLRLQEQRAEADRKAQQTLADQHSRDMQMLTAEITRRDTQHRKDKERLIEDHQERVNQLHREIGQLKNRPAGAKPTSKQRCLLL